ncbi:MAG: alternative ribosome rescue aminoacyl-tRNA hydrolase ArfB [Myxococcota bacterium]|nr:alternative ribosome rescue aminoacyl-tRNA hydrolase ArfB [Myxococcota bacterium]
MADDLPITDHLCIPGSSLRVAHSRSGGPGGQNVNMRATRVQLFCALQHTGLHPAVIRRLEESFGSRINESGELRIDSANSRSQADNLQEARDRLAEMIRGQLQPPKRRRKTRPSRASKERRLKAKSQRSEKKRSREKPDY